MFNDALPIGLQFTILHRTFRQKMDEAVKDFDLTGAQFAVLGQLARLEFSGCGEVSQKMLEEATHTTHATMTEILKKLEKKGFILCRPSEVDRRSKAICSTEKSLALHSHMDECDGAIFAALSAGIPSADIDTTLRTVSQMLKNAHAYDGECCFMQKGDYHL